MSSIARNSVYNILGSGVPLILALVTVPIYLKTIGSERYGVLAIGWLFLGYFGVLDLGLGRATSYQIAMLRDASPRERAEVFWTSTLLNPAMGVVGAILLYAASIIFFDGLFKVDDAIRVEVLRSLPILAIGVPITTATATFSGALIGRQKFALNNLALSFSSALYQVAPLAVALAFGPSLPNLILAAVVAKAMGTLLLGIASWLEIGRGHTPNVSMSRLRALLGFGSWASVNSLISPLLVLTDRFMIGTILGASAVGYYTIPFQLAQRIAIFPAAITSALFPRISGVTAEVRTALSNTATRTILGMLTPVIAVGIGLMTPFFDLWVGHATGHLIATTGKLLAIAYWLNALALVPCVALQAAGKPNLVTRALLIEIPFFLPVLYILMQAFGIAGCAFAIVLRFYCDLALQNWLAFRTLPSAQTHGMLALLGLILALSTRSSGLHPGAAILFVPVFVASYMAMPASVMAKLIGFAPGMRGRRQRSG